MNRYNRFKQASKILKNPMCYDHVQYRAAKRMAIRALRKETPTMPQRKIYIYWQPIQKVNPTTTDTGNPVGLIAYSFYFEHYIRCVKYTAANDWYFVFVDAPDMEPLRAGSPHHCFMWKKQEGSA